MLLALLLAGGLCTGAQAGLADLFRGSPAGAKHPPNTVHSSLKQPPIHLVHGARQTPIKPVLGNTRTAARTLTLKPRPRH
jgi:hypothetical protein